MFFFSELSNKIDGLYEILNKNDTKELDIQNCVVKGWVHFPNTGKCYTFSSNKLGWDDDAMMPELSVKRIVVI